MDMILDQPEPDINIDSLESSSASSDKDRISIEDQILEIIGRPENKYQMVCKNVYDNYWRVNLYIYFSSPDSVVDKKSLNHSFFVTFEDGVVVHSSPALKKLY